MDIFFLPKKENRLTDVSALNEKKIRRIKKQKTKTTVGIYV